MKTLHQTDPIKVCAEKLRKECEVFDFLLDNSYCDAEDLECNLKNYKEHCPKSWELFFKTLFIYGKESVHIQHKCDNIFQMIFNVVHNGQKKTPMHVGLSETVHDICHSKELIQIINPMGLCQSYNEVERLDSGLAQRTFEKAGVHRVHIPPSIEHGILIQGTMDNFDHEENTKSGIGGSHDTILMLFQNTANEIGDKPKEISTKPSAQFERKALDRILDCQKLVRAAKYRGCCQIPATFVPSPPPDTRELEISMNAAPDTRELEISMNADFMSWVIAKFATKKHIPDFSSCENPRIPSFATTNSLLYHWKKSMCSIVY